LIVGFSIFFSMRQSITTAAISCILLVGWCNIFFLLAAIGCCSQLIAAAVPPFSNLVTH